MHSENMLEELLERCSIDGARFAVRLSTQSVNNNFAN